MHEYRGTWMSAGTVAGAERRRRPVLVGGRVSVRRIGADLVRRALTMGLVAVALLVGVCAAPALAEAALCPNAGVLAEDESFLGFAPEVFALPECRGYDLVSSPYKEGFPFNAVAAVSEDGERIVASSFGAFAESESDPVGSVTVPEQAGVLYEFSRERSEWTASALNPSAARFPAQRFSGVSGDLKRTLWIVREPSQSIYSADLYVREEDGAFVKIGPVTRRPASAPTAGYDGELPDSASVVGTSRDLSHVLFSLRAPGAGEPNLLWEGDTTTALGYSLYEYAGTGAQEPRLVGVENNEEHKLISSCDTWLGGAGLQGVRYNAVSESGETVFFTAAHEEATCAGPPVDEMYARVGGSETVAISNPSKSQCGECVTSVKHPAAFQGASEDGSKVFFTSSRLLPGDEGSNLYEYDFKNPAGEKIVRVSSGAPHYETTEPNVVGVARISDDGSHVYFVATAPLTGAVEEEEPGGGTRKREPVPGGDNLYVYERDSEYPHGHTALVATLSAGDSLDWSSGGEHLEQVQCTPDGRFLVFVSSADLTPGDSSTVGQLFEYDARSETLVRVSAGREGYNGDGNTEKGYERAKLPSLRAVSEDGSRVFFESADGLTPGALNGAEVDEVNGRATYAENVYEYHSTVGGEGFIAQGTVTLVSDGGDLTIHEFGESNTQLYGTDAEGGDVFFGAGVPLVGQDTDTQRDIYDARVDGGFPQPFASSECVGEECLGAPAIVPSFGAPLSASTPGGGNSVTPPAPSLRAKTSKRKNLTRAQRRVRALRACAKKRSRKRRVACRRRARRRYGGRRGARSRAGSVVGATKRGVR
jgi:hypothetical protein